MDFLFKPQNLEPCDCNFIEQDINRCPFLKNINKPTNFSFDLNFPVPSKGAKGPIFEDGPNFNLAFKLFHGKDGVLPLNGNSSPEFHKPETDVVPELNHLASTAASISMSAFGPGGPFGFHYFFGKKLNKESESSRKEDSAKIIGSRAERLRLRAKAESAKVVARASSPAGVSGYGSVKKADVVSVGYCGKEIAKISSPPPSPSVCF